MQHNEKKIKTNEALLLEVELTQLQLQEKQWELHCSQRRV
jgi:hypothetical protein